MRERSCGRTLLLFIVGLGGLCLIAGFYYWEANPGVLISQSLPPFSTAPAHALWPTPPIADTFDFPLLPADAYEPYVQGVTGPLVVDTRYGVQNPATGNYSNCFRDASGGSVPFNHLYHAGVDLFALNDAGQVVWGQATGVPVHAVADGVVVFTVDAGSEGRVVGVQHRLAGNSTVYSVYWHVAQVQVREGQPVSRGQMLAIVHDMGFNSHLHWEMRTFRDGSNMFPPGTAGARGTCNRQVPGVGYTWDDNPRRAHPDFYGYLDPIAFVEGHRQ